MFRVCLIRFTFAGPRRQREISNIRPQTSATRLGQQSSARNWNIKRWTFTSDSALLRTIFRARVKHEVYNVTFQAFRPRLQRQTPAMSDLKLSVRDCNIRPQQYKIPRFSCETTISGPDNVRPHTFHGKLQYQTPRTSDSTLFERPGPDNVRPHGFRGKLQYQAPTMSDFTFCRKLQYQTPTMSDPTLFVRDYQATPRLWQTPPHPVLARLQYQASRLFWCKTTIISGNEHETCSV